VTVTETPVVARRLELAATHFPNRADSRADLLLALTEVAEQALLQADGDDGGRAAAKRRLLDHTRKLSPETAQAMLDAREADWQSEP